jgi:hypothetical protein
VAIVTRTARVRRPEWFPNAIKPSPDEALVETTNTKLVNDFLVGCDPEFIILDDKGKVVNVQRQFDNNPKGEVGFDHNGMEVECRPKPARGTYMVLKRLQQLILTHNRLEKLKDKKWRSGAFYDNGDRKLTLGGHVHLGLPPAGYGAAQAEHDARISALDRVTKFMEGLDLLPTVECERRRTVGDDHNRMERYGRWGDWRVAGEDEGNGVARTEYRTMASWLYSPEIAYLALTGAKLAACAPSVALDILKARNVSYESFRQFFEHFKHRDTNAVRAVEKVLCKNVSQLQAQPDINFRPVWERIDF